MTITAPRSNYLRTSENTKDGDRQAVAEMRRLAKLDADKERDSFESLSYRIGGGMVAAGVVAKPSFEELYDAMLAEDLSTYAIDGLVR